MQAHILDTRPTANGKLTCGVVYTCPAEMPGSAGSSSFSCHESALVNIYLVFVLVNSNGPAGFTGSPKVCDVTQVHMHAFIGSLAGPRAGIAELFAWMW